MSRTLRGLGSALGEARRGLAPRRRRALLTAVGIALAAAMLSAAVVVADGLGLGFDRAARAADLPDVIVRFDDEPRSLVAARIQSLPDVAGYATRSEVTNVGIGAGGGELRRGDAVAEVVGSGTRRGYAVVDGHDLVQRQRGARREGVRAGLGAASGRHDVRQRAGTRAGRRACRGTRQRRVSARQAALLRGPHRAEPPLRRTRDPRVNYAEIWARDPRYLNELLVQARATSFGLHNVRFATRSGVRVSSTRPPASSSTCWWRCR